MTMHVHQDKAGSTDAVHEAVARLRRRAEALSETQIRLAVALFSYSRTRLYRALGYTRMGDFARSEFPHMSDRTIRAYVETGAYLDAVRIPVEEAARRGFDRVQLEARAYQTLQTRREPTRNLQDFAADELWRAIRGPNHGGPGSDEDQTTGAQFVGQVITAFSCGPRCIRVATARATAAIQTPGGRGHVVMRVVPG